MAGMGPPPNPNARRTNNRASGFTTLTEGRKGPAPKLPERLDGDWSPAVLEAWKRWWKSPQATQWTDSDFPNVVLLATFLKGAIEGSTSAATEFRQWSDRLGLNPLARLRNRWLIENGSEAEGAAKAAEAVTPGNVVQLRPTA